MTKVHQALNARAVMTLGEGRYTDGEGLRLQVSKAGGRSWVVNYQFDGKRREMGLGCPPEVGLADARDAAREVRKKVRAGKDPLEQAADEAKEAARLAASTFGPYAQKFIDEREGTPAWESNKTVQGWTNSLVNHAAALKDMSLAAITTEDVLAVLRPIWRKTPSIAEKTQARIAQVLDAAKVEGYRSGENPARWVGHLEHALKKHDGAIRGPHAALPADDAPAFMSRLRQRTGAGALALELTILTGVRTSETCGATWGEIDLKEKVWAIPVARCKNRKMMRKLNRTHHRVPLSTAALAVLEKAAALRLSDEPGAWVFPGEKEGQAISTGTMERVLDRMKLKGEITVHGFRSTLRDWAGDKTIALPDGQTVHLYTYEACEITLGHIVGSAVERAYRRGDCLDERAKLAQGWADYLGRPVALKRAA